jgi:hypothetical protein
MAVVKANYVKRGKGEKGRAKATIRYITHRRDRDNQTVTRKLFGFDGELTREQAYRMIDEAPQKGNIFYRIVISPAPRQEDRYRDLDLESLTLDTILKLEERIGKQVQFAGAIHDDHSPNRHVHTLVLVQGKRLTREDFQALRETATEHALAQRRIRDQIREQRRRLRLSKYRFKTKTYSLRSGGRFSAPRYFSFLNPYIKPIALNLSYTCPLCGYHQALPYSKQGYRCPLDGLYLRRGRDGEGLTRYRHRERGYGLELSLSP